MQALHAYIFQLTTSRGGRHFRHHRPSCPAIISTHDLTRRSTRVAFRKNWKIKSFNSRPHEEIDAFYRCLINVLVISTHDLARRSTTEFYDLGLGSSTFQLTTSQGGRPRKAVPSLSFNGFQLTTSQGGRRSNWQSSSFMELFQLTTSQGGRHDDSDHDCNS